MKDDQRIIQESQVDPEDTYASRPDSQQSLTAAFPAADASQADPAGSLSQIGAIPPEGQVEIVLRDDGLLVAAPVHLVDDFTPFIDVPLVLSDSVPAQADVRSDTLNPGLPVVSAFRATGQYLTVVELDAVPPVAHYLRLEDGSGFMTFEDGRRILIL